MSVVNSPVRLYTFIFLDDALSVGNDAMYSEPSSPFRTMPKSSYVIEKNALTARLMSLSRDTEVRHALVHTLILRPFTVAFG